MPSNLDKKFVKIWQSLKNHAAVKSSPWFKKADAAVSKKATAYQEALHKAQSGLVDDLLALGKALRDLEEAFVKSVDAQGLSKIGDGDVKRGDLAPLVAELNRYRSEVQHERSLFDSRLKTALSAADNDLKKLELIETGKKREIWKGFGIEL